MGRPNSAQRPNVLVHAEEVFRIVLRLELLEPPVVGPIGGGDRLARLIVGQVIHIAAGGHEGLHPGIRFPRPGNASIVMGLLHPFAEYEEVVALRAVREGRVADPDPGCRAVEVLEEQLAHWGGALSARSRSVSRSTSSVMRW